MQNKHQPGIHRHCRNRDTEKERERLIPFATEFYKAFVLLVFPFLQFHPPPPTTSFSYHHRPSFARSFTQHGQLIINYFQSEYPRLTGWAFVWEGRLALDSGPIPVQLYVVGVAHSQELLLLCKDGRLVWTKWKREEEEAFGDKWCGCFSKRFIPFVHCKLNPFKGFLAPKSCCSPKSQSPSSSHLISVP